MKIIFMGTPDFSVSALDALVGAGHEILCVYSQPPRPAGRGKKLRASPVQIRAEELGLMVRHPEKLRGAEEQAAFEALGADIAVVVAYGLILPQAILEAPRLGCLNIHASLLPRWRGAAPIQRAIMAGDAETGVTIMQMERGLDTGPMLLDDRMPIHDGQTAGELHDELSAMGAELIVKAIDQIKGLKATQQPDNGVTYASKIDKTEAVVDWTKDASTVARHINGLSPFPGAFVEHEGQRIKLLRALVEGASGTPGQVVSDGFCVACGTKSVRIVTAQRQGKRPMDEVEFLRGFQLPSTF